ncbi:S53 family peptidase [Actinospica durhamensis]|uniref:S53 family peptidase n=1 Tax=Actinospica durhamensis TaxID=1508375 RepID=A0A941IRR8_9ACTN|nr:S53 family peptidase [Actinospica durhamensis]MBR7837659.1 S53 family peptidase [Actinospica durhamensis]
MPRLIPTLAFAVTAAAVGLGASPALAATVPAAAAAPAATAHFSAPATSAAGYAHSDAIRNNAKSHKVNATANATPSGYGPSSIQSAYALPSSTAGSGETVAIVDAYNDPNAAADLAVYRSEFGLSACTVASGCLKIVSQTGSTTSLPAKNAGWATEESLDLDMVSATCPNCKIILVEATTSSNANLGKAVNEAASLGANAISNSYGGSESSTDTTYDTSYYDHPGIAITASSGDSGYGAQYPAASPYVTAVGGTSLSTASNTRGWTETAWSDAGAGCSAYDAQPSYQASVGTGCAKRAIADVSAVADPNTGVATYDSTSYEGYVGWQVYGGTSVASPIIASVYALAGNTSSVDNAALAYANTGSLYDVTSGSDGSCSVSQLCTARVGWDGPTGLGTPDGVGAF